MNSFWQTLSKPFCALAPMGGVTDYAFREMVARHAKPDVLFTEFVNVESLCSDGKAEEIKRLRFSDAQRPIVAQLWGNKPENFCTAARLVASLGFDGIDINMGCSIDKILSRGIGGSLMKHPDLCREIIDSTRVGAPALPVSVKTRWGYSAYSPEWFEFLLSMNLSALTIHARTVQAGYRGDADWTKLKNVVNIRKRLSATTVIIGNGDVTTRTQGVALARSYGVDGIMIGRAIMQNFFVFARRSDQKLNTRENLLRLLSEHIDRAVESNERAAKETMKKFYKMYLRDFDGALPLRKKLMAAESLLAAKKITEQ